MEVGRWGDGEVGNRESGEVGRPPITRHDGSDDGVDQVTTGIRFTPGMVGPEQHRDRVHRKRHHL